MGLLVAILKGFSLFIGAAPYVPSSIHVFMISWNQKYKDREILSFIIRFLRLPAGMLPDAIQALQKRLKSLLSSVEDQTNATVSNMNFLDQYIQR